MKLKDKVIVVIGASGGIGRVLAKEFHQAGATVVLSARTEEKLIGVQNELGKDRTIVCPADATNPNDVSAILDWLDQKCKLLVDGIVISAGTWKRLDIEAFPSQAVALAKDHFNAIFMPTFVTAFVAQRYFANHKRPGLIVNISSHAAVKPELPGNLTYGPMKAASWHFLASLMYEIKDPNIRIVDLKPAIVNTPDNAALLDTKEKRSQAVQPEAIARWIIDHFDDSDDRLPMSVDFTSSVIL